MCAYFGFLVADFLAPGEGATSHLCASGGGNLTVLYHIFLIVVFILASPLVKCFTKASLLREAIVQKIPEFYEILS